MPPGDRSAAGASSAAGARSAAGAVSVAGDDTIGTPVYFDFASSLCHVAHRVMQRMAPVTDELGIRLQWIPIDLAALLNWRRGHPVSELRRQHVRTIANELRVDLEIPTHWLESRSLAALNLHQHGVDRATGSVREPTLREVVFTRVFDEARPCGEAGQVVALAHELGLEFAAPELEAGLDALEAWTRHAADQMVTGVPTFMLGPWPFGGIQQDDTMESIFRRWARKQRAAETR